MSASDNAASLVREGATGEIHFDDGYEVLPSPVLAIKIDEESARFFWLSDDQEHAVDLGQVTDGDDGDVFVSSPAGVVLRIWGIFEDDDWNKLRQYVAGVRSGQQPPLGLDDSWTRYKELV